MQESANCIHKHSSDNQADDSHLNYEAASCCDFDWSSFTKTLMRGHIYVHNEHVVQIFAVKSFYRAPNKLQRMFVRVQWEIWYSLGNEIKLISRIQEIERILR